MLYCTVSNHNSFEEIPGFCFINHAVFEICNFRKVLADQMTPLLWRLSLIILVAMTALFWTYSKLSIAHHSNVPGAINSPQHSIHFCVSHYPFHKGKVAPS